MYHDLLRDARFWSFLTDVDRDLAEMARRQACRCGGRLHRADYARKPRGGPEDLPDAPENEAVGNYLTHSGREAGRLRQIIGDAPDRRPENPSPIQGEPGDEVEHAQADVDLRNPPGQRV